MKLNTAILDDVRLNYLQLAPAGDLSRERQDIVLVHGLATNMAFWHIGVAKALSYYGRVTAFDLRGHGGSSMPSSGYLAKAMAEDMRQLLDQLEIDSAHFIGHSYGGLAAAEFAVAHPLSVNSLLLADVRFPSMQPHLSMMSASLPPKLKVSLKRAGISIDETDGDFGLELLTAIAKLRIVNAPRGRLLDKLVGGGRGMGKRTAAKWLELLETTSARRDLAIGSAIVPGDLQVANCAVYGLYGENSMTVSSGRALSDMLAGAKFETIKGAGHFFPTARPREFAIRALTFLGSQMNVSSQNAAISAAIFGEGSHQIH